MRKKFRINGKHLAKIKKLADFTCIKINNDVYYDDKKYALTTKDIWLRNRNGIWELKYPIKAQMKDRIIWVYDEIIGPKKISKRLELKKVSSNFEANLEKMDIHLLQGSKTRGKNTNIKVL